MARFTDYVQQHFPSRLDIGYNVRGYFKTVKLAEMLHTEYIAFFVYISKKGGRRRNGDVRFKYGFAPFPHVQGYAFAIRWAHHQQQA